MKTPDKKYMCSNCKKEYIPSKASKYDYKIHDWKKHFCSMACNLKYREQFRINTECSWCGKRFSMSLADSKRTKSGRHYCCKSHAASYNNKLKRKSRRSKCEIMLFDLLTDEFKQLNIVANDKTALDGLEMDISIPSLKIGIEWNGIVHFKPIYGEKKLERIRQLDAQKIKTAQDKGIHLIVVPDLVSTKKEVEKAFKEIVPFIESLL